jgi:hypothetical protein
MASRQRDGIPITCGRPRCGRELCRALLAPSGEDPVVVLVDVRRPARLTPAEAAEGPIRRVLLVCRGRVTADGRTARCTNRRRLRLDRGRLVDLVRDPGGRQQLVLGVDL